MAQGEIIVGLVSNSASAANTIVQSSADGTARYELVNNIGQIIASVTSIFPVLAPLGIQTNVLAGTMTFLKIVVDVKAGRSIQASDALTLVSNVAGVVATVAVLAGAAPSVIVVVAAVGVIANVSSIMLGDNGLRDLAMQKIQEWWPRQPTLEMPDRWFDTNGQSRRYDDILNDPSVGFQFITITKDSFTTGRAASPPPRPVEPEEVDGDGQM